jgi:hypothetical protein
MHPTEEISLLKSISRNQNPIKLADLRRKKRQKIMAFSHFSIFKTMKVPAIAVSEV